MSIQLLCWLWFATIETSEAGLPEVGYRVGPEAHVSPWAEPLWTTCPRVFCENHYLDLLMSILLSLHNLSLNYASALNILTIFTCFSRGQWKSQTQI